jgi:predicted component of type VI protein secretion system
MFSDVEFRLRSRVKADSSEAVVIKYLNSRNTLYPAKDMAMIAISSYWLPLAYQAVDQSVDLEPHIRACLYRLQLHSSYLMGLLGEIPSQGTPMIAVASNQSQPLQLIQSEPLPISRTSVKEALQIARTPVPEELEPETDWLNPF